MLKKQQSIVSNGLHARRVDQFRIVRRIFSGGTLSDDELKLSNAAAAAAEQDVPHNKWGHFKDIQKFTDRAGVITGDCVKK